MYRSKLFNLSRRRLAIWYAGVMGVILSAGGLVFYHMIAQAHWHALHRELESVAGTLHDGLEPVLKQPSQMDEQAVNQVLPYVCLANTSCSLPPELTHRHSLSLFQQKGYYIRFLEDSNQKDYRFAAMNCGKPWKIGRVIAFTKSQCSWTLLIISKPGVICNLADR